MTDRQLLLLANQIINKLWHDKEARKCRLCGNRTGDGHDEDCLIQKWIGFTTTKEVK